MYGQNCNYTSPLKSATILSGSYGEPRTAHFHAGIDFKQRYGIPQDTIFSVEEGNISRINIQPDGYGNAIYIDHPCGQTSVYAHLYELAPNIRKYINEVMTRRKVYKIDRTLKSDEILISKGEPIGVMGSTGRSSGPHLHFEIRNTKTEKSINPALLGFKPTDNIAPVINGIVIYAFTPDGQEIKREYQKATLNKDGRYQLKNTSLLLSDLTIGIGIHTYDTMNGAKNHNGIYALDMKVDGQSQFSFKLDSLPFETSRYIHAHMDYEAKMNKKYIIKCFRSVDNPLQIYSEASEGGIISTYSFKNRNIDIAVFDIEGNKSEISFTVKRTEELAPITLPNHEQSFRISPSDSSIFDGIHTDILIPPHAVSSPTFINLSTDNPLLINLTQKVDIPLFKYMKVKKHIPSRTHPKEKYTFTKTTEKGEIKRYKGKWENDTTLVTYIMDFDQYLLNIDTIPPRIRAISLPSSNKKRGTFLVTDNFEPAYRNEALKFNVYLDDEWILCQHDIKSNRIWWDMPNNNMNKTHFVRVIASDSSGNESTLERSFKY
ncbi:MAG: hypothetical protein ACJA01_000366 [Saprospiraceae bacterium]|jgi:hypothetical protein